MDKRRRRKQANGSSTDNAWKPNSDEIDVATYMYRKLPAKEARLSGMVVRVFLAEDAVSLLMESPWSVASNTTNSKKSKPCFFSTRDSTVSFLTTLLQKQMFHRYVSSEVVFALFRFVCLAYLFSHSTTTLLFFQSCENR